MTSNVWDKFLYGLDDRAGRKTYLIVPVLAIAVPFLGVAANSIGNRALHSAIQDSSTRPVNTDSLHDASVLPCIPTHRKAFQHVVSQPDVVYSRLKHIAIVKKGGRGLAVCGLV